MQRRSLVAIVGATAAALTITTVGVHEGISNYPYRDTGGIWTVCRGQTGIPMHYYTDSACDAILADSLASYAQQIENSTPGFARLPDGVKTATIDFTYNVGIGNYNASTYRKMLINNDLPNACDQILRYRYVAKKDCRIRSNNCYGVWQRRMAERGLCRGDTQ